MWKKGELGDEDQTSFAALTTFVARIPRVQCAGWEGKSVTDKNREIMYVSSLIVVKEILESEDPVKYLGIYL